MGAEGESVFGPQGVKERTSERLGKRVKIKAGRVTHQRRVLGLGRTRFELGGGGKGVLHRKKKEKERREHRSRNKST